MDKTELTELIMKLADTSGVSGNEDETAELCLEIMKKYTPCCMIKNGNVIANFGTRSESRPHLLIDAHLDRVGLIVSYITEDGFLKVANIGGLDRRLFPAQKVTVHGKDGSYSGVICVLPPHLKGGDSKVMSADDVCIDVGMSREEAYEKIPLGSTVSFDSHPVRLLGDRICSSALDDRCGIAAIIAAVDTVCKKVKDPDELPFSFTVMFSAQEELGERGAAVGAFDIDPDIAVAVDVSFALAKGEKAEKCGEMGKGCMIGIAPSLDRKLSKCFIDYAEDKNIPYQLEVMNGQTGTNADRFSICRNGSRAVTLSIPLRYMHTPAEVISAEDVMLTAQLLSEYILGGERI
ncbi:MAG: M42 family metallopeptidase [Huintestinicola sp.]